MKNLLDQYEALPEKLFSFTIYFLKPYKWRWFFLLCFIVYLGLHISLEPYSLKLIIDNILKHQGINSISQIGIFLIFFVLVRLMHSVSAFGIDALLAYIHPNIKRDIAAHLLNNLWYHTAAFYDEELSGSLSSKISKIQDSIQNLLDNVRRIFRFFCEILFACIATSLIHPIYILVILGWSSVFVIFGFLFSSALSKLSYHLSESSNETFGKIVDVVSNIFTVKIFHRYSYENKYISSYLQTTANREKNFRLLQAKSWVVLDVFCLFLSIGMITILVMLMQNTMITTGDFTFIVMVSASLTATVFGILEQFEDFIGNIGAGKQSLEVFFKMIDQKEINISRTLHVHKGMIEFNKVDFQYGETQIFKDLSVMIKGGEKIGLVGISGSGKSTFVKLILRLIEPKDGSIKIDGSNISEVSKSSIMESISFINQDPLLFHRSIKENIRYGNPYADDKEIIAASKKAFIHDFIVSLPDGYETLVGERGVKLSGGQRQRVAMARAFLKSSKILIMDEATSSLDTITEKNIQKSLLRLTTNKTSIIIAHRLSTVSKLSRIFVFDKGRIVEEGSPDELLKINGLYKKLWNHSIDGLLPENLEDDSVKNGNSLKVI